MTCVLTCHDLVCCNLSSDRIFPIDGEVCSVEFSRLSSGISFKQNGFSFGLQALGLLAIKAGKMLFKFAGSGDSIGPPGIRYGRLFGVGGTSKNGSGIIGTAPSGKSGNSGGGVNVFKPFDIWNKFACKSFRPVSLEELKIRIIHAFKK